MLDAHFCALTDIAHRVFVFGTLKEGFPNFAVNKGIRLSGNFETEDRYPLYPVGERHSPWFILDVGRGEHVKGQVFEVSPETLVAMDLLERISESDGYRRVSVKVRPVDIPNPDSMSLFAYLKPANELDAGQIRLGPLHKYELSHAALYRSRSGN